MFVHPYHVGLLAVESKKKNNYLLQYLIEFNKNNNL